MYPPITHLYRCRRGSGALILVTTLAVVISLIAISTAKISQASQASLASSKTALQAQQYAAAEAEIIKTINYNDLQAQNKTEIQNSDFQKEIALSGESDYDDATKMRTATIKIYKGSEVLPRYSLDVIRLSTEKSSGVPIGTIIAWAGTTPPSEGGTWLLCNGQSAAAYPKLAAIVGNTIPNLNGRFLEGTTGTPGTFKEAGLPKIPIIRAVTTILSTGCVYATEYVLPTSGTTPAFITGDRDDGGRAGAIKFHMSEIGNASTVQPPSYTVRYYIKAA